MNNKEMNNTDSIFLPKEKNWEDILKPLLKREGFFDAPYPEVGIGSHATRVANITAKIATSLEFPPNKVNELWWAARCHDIGKITLDSSILDKPSQLTFDEKKYVDTHTSAGHDLLVACDADIPSSFLEAALYHHEKFNGTGNNFLSGYEIPVVARIVQIADIFDAMTAKRKYREPWSESKMLCVMVSDDPKLGRCIYDNYYLSALVKMKLLDNEFSCSESERKILMNYAKIQFPMIDITYQDERHYRSLEMS